MLTALQCGWIGGKQDPDGQDVCQMSVHMISQILNRHK